MGATTFTTLAEGPDVAKAFREACEDAAYEHGHGGYTGTIAEKGSYIVLSTQPLPEEQAYQQAENMLDTDDRRIADKWGPAGALPVSLKVRRMRLTDVSYTEGADLKDVAHNHLVDRGLLKTGESVRDVRPVIRNYDDRRYRPGPTRFYNCTFEVFVTKSPNARPVTDAWLFFGWASE